MKINLNGFVMENLCQKLKMCFQLERILCYFEAEREHVS